MGVRISQYTGQRFVTTMPEAGNQNPHHTLFAGSLFSLATLTGWGLIWLLLRERHLGGTIILADAHIRYSAPVTGRPRAVAELSSLSGDLDRLARGRRARVQLNVNCSAMKIRGLFLKELIWCCLSLQAMTWLINPLVPLKSLT